MLPFATTHVAHLCVKAYAGEWGFKLSSLLIRRVSFEISSYCAKQTSSFFSHIITKYLIIVNIFCYSMQHCKRLSVILKIWNVVLRVKVQ